jgi:hypothetical protein
MRRRDVLAALTKADDLEAQGVEFGVGFLSGCPEHFVGIRTNRGAAWRRHLLGQFNHALGGRRGIEAAALHAVELGCERGECFAVQLALWMRHFVGGTRESGCRFRGAPS